MSKDLQLLKLFQKRENYDKYYKFIDNKILDSETKRILKIYSQYFNELEKDVTTNEITEFAFHYMNLKWSEEKKLSFETILSNLDELPFEEDMLKKYISLELAEKLLIEINKVLDGADDNSMDKVRNLISEYDDKYQLIDAAEHETIITSSTLMFDEDDSRRLSFSLKVLNDACSGVSKGNLCIVFARPNAGKTSFVVNETYHMMKQLPPEKKIVWINNEEDGRNIMLRYFSRAWQKPDSQILERLQHYNQKFTEYFGEDRIIIYDEADCSKNKIEKFLERFDVGLIIFNNLDKVRGFGGEGHTMLQKLYQWARELSKKHCPVFAVCQCSQEGEGEQTLYQNYMADSKTDKAGEADLIVGIGNDNVSPNIRYINIAKNKLRSGSGGARHIFGIPVKFNENLATFEDMNNGYADSDP